jgi:hypothetical protein
MEASNLPQWDGASAVYSKCYRFLELMAQHGHVTTSHWRGKDKCITSEEMDLLVSALNEGDEERIKGYVFLYRDRFSYLRTI